MIVGVDMFQIVRARGYQLDSVAYCLIGHKWPRDILAVMFVLEFDYDIFLYMLTPYPQLIDCGQLNCIIWWSFGMFV